MTLALWLYVLPLMPPVIVDPDIDTVIENYQIIAAADASLLPSWPAGASALPAGPV